MTAPGIPHVLTLDSSGLGDRSYVVHDGRTALVVDPQRDIDRVERLAAEHGLTITHVAETHFHNDYVSGGIELARKHGAAYIVPSGFDIQYAAIQVDDGDAFTVGGLKVEVIHTPGHTPNHMSYAVRIGDNSVVFTGGGLLYGSVGRPDLVSPDLTVKQAHDQWHSAQRLADKLDDDTAIFPTHGFGSFCSATQTQGVSSTILLCRRPIAHQPHEPSWRRPSSSCALASPRSAWPSMPRRASLSRRTQAPRTSSQPRSASTPPAPTPSRSSALTSAPLQPYKPASQPSLSARRPCSTACRCSFRKNSSVCSAYARFRA
jgi:glyoxylase-like metal-dependent hydrolase (beta-lactamase superfamily II)